MGRYCNILSKLTKYILALNVLLHASDIVAQNKSQVEILNSNFFRSNKNVANGARRLIGNVIFKQDSTIMKCDSAWYNTEANTFEAFSNVHLYKIGDNNISVKSDFLKHNGNTKTAQFRRNVVLRDSQVVMETDSLDYDIRNDIGYYLYGAKIVDSATTLVSQRGYYYNRKNEIYFKKDVVVNHNGGEFQMFTDTLKYNTIKKTIHFFGPTEFYNDTNYMYSENGWYNTERNIANFNKKTVYTNPKQSIVADSLYYDRDNERGIWYSNVVATDTAQQMVIKGNLLKVFKNPEKVLITDSAMVISILEGDSVFIHADTIITEFDTSKVHRIFKAFHHTRIFKSNFQAQTDSLFFSMKDSILQMHGSPVIWAEGSQITAQYIEAFMRNEKLDRFKLYKGGLIVSQQDSNHFNQVKGVELVGYLKNNSLSKIEVYKKSETIYFPVDEYGIIGANLSQSENMTILMKNNKIGRIIYRDGYTGKMYPLEELLPKEQTVRGFIWIEDQRPKKPEDIFIWHSTNPVSEAGEKLPVQRTPNFIQKPHSIK